MRETKRNVNRSLSLCLNQRENPLYLEAFETFHKEKPAKNKLKIMHFFIMKYQNTKDENTIST